jgi:UDP-GlcNAc:undecaprenyl-phosphate/decaprenyl-phosphate GlcNAc-1-phosphate transferase
MTAGGLVAPAIVALGVSLAAGGGSRLIGPRLGAMDHPGELKTHARPVSHLGGFAVAAGVAVGMASRSWSFTWGATIAVAGVLLLGAADDFRDISAAHRLPAIVVLAVALPASGLTVSGLPGGSLVAWLVPIAIFACSVNAVNMVDGLDGLAGSAATISALGLAVIARDSRAPGPELIAVVLAAACLGFVIHNFPPARLFLGNGGAYMIGAILTVAIVGSSYSAATLLGAISCMGIFAMDLGLALLRRLANHTPLTAGDRGHFYDQIGSRGLSNRLTLGVSLAVHLAIVGAGARTAELPFGQAAIVIGAIWLIVLAWLILAGFVTLPR